MTAYHIFGSGAVVWYILLAWGRRPSDRTFRKVLRRPDDPAMVWVSQAPSSFQRLRRAFHLLTYDIRSRLGQTFLGPTP